MAGQHIECLIYQWTLVGGKDVCVSPMYNTIEKSLVGTLQQVKFHLNVKKNILTCIC